MSTIKVDTIATRTGSGNITASNTIAGTSATLSGTLGVTGAITGTTQTLNRSGNGDIVDVQKDGTSVGTIGANGSNLYIGSPEGTDAYLGFGNQIIRPVTSAGASRDNAIDLGYTGMRFRDIYLSGGAYIGGTGAANKLDDFEEGTFAVTLGSDSSGSLPTFANTGYYVKVGKIVHLHGQVTISGSSSGGSNIHIVLPFTVTDTRGALTVGLNQPISMATNGEYLSIVTELNSTKGYIVSHAFGGGHSHLDFNQVGTGIFSFSGSYRVA